MGKYQAYPEHKDSGVDWLGSIPVHWQVVPIKRLAVINPKKSAIDTELLKQQCSFLPMEKLKLDSIILDETQLVGDVFKGYTYFENGDVLMAKVTPCFENKNIAVASHLVNSIGFGSTEIYVLRSNSTVHNRFLFYRLQEDNFMSIAIASMSGAGGLKRVPAEVISNHSIAIPKLNEQTQIANFLDHETAKIDALIEKQQQLISLLQEKRQAVISHAVTKGLNPDVPMKDSGVEWLGQVPEHWEIKQLKHFGVIVGGFAFKSSDFTDEGYPVIKISNVSHLAIDWSDRSYLPESFVAEHRDYIAPKGALVFAMTRPIISGGIKVFLMDDESLPLINQRVGFMKATDNEVSRFILMSSLSNSFIAQFTNNMTVTNQPNISGEGIGSIRIPLPPSDELAEINNKLLHLNTMHSKTMEKCNHQISLLKERRTALISAAVTGKIDVRNWQAPSQSSTTSTEEQAL
ncbi:restriction endonuclease subunit S [Plesiomonas shigelloides]|uniref:restriction endonuclease subunit S n=1 Tax=Plesiomonas shigelloides TaxID=703 RepID=UPI0022456819|nr:restriction endonuclease subunit S [Plesiomonas shigelloides]MCX2532938.1 restriction endonuclease subunit S [Plesiomonas shigelloides]